MSKILYLVASILILVNCNQMNKQHSVERWGTYIASYEDDNPGSTTLRMDLINVAPLENLNYVLITGITYKTPRKDGFPEEDVLSTLHKMGEELVELVEKETASIWVGSFTYNKERLEYIYLKEPEGIKEKIENYYKANFPNDEYYINIKEDKEWKSYRDFLYPNEETLNYMTVESVLSNLEEAGDNLTKKRRVDHWLYFSSESERNKCKEELLKQKFTIEPLSMDKETSLPFKLQVWRIDHVDINSIYPIISELRKIAKEFNGEYDGWETSVEKE